jgi:hypothetical protein|tara:strand:- start:535 stop:771 length:237 start_codon:yes stop_codon:yes gene_type:complete
MTLEEVYRKYEQLTLEICAGETSHDNTLECAGAMMGQAMKLYKLVLSPEDFDALMHIISQASGLDDGFDDDFPSGTLH